MSDSPRTGAVTLGVVLWLVQPLSIVVELVAAALSRAPYSLRDNTISDLGATTCTTIPYPAQDVAVCSPAHALVNGSFVVLGLAMAVGALLLRSRLPGRPATAATVVWVVAGLSSVGSGLTPLDRQLELHALVSVPAILLCGVATALTGVSLAAADRRWHGLTAAGVVSVCCGALMLVRLEVADGGLLERAALWPSFLALALVAVHLARRDTRAGSERR